MARSTGESSHERAEKGMRYAWRSRSRSGELRHRPMLDPSVQPSSKVPPDKRQPNVVAGGSETPASMQSPAGASIWTPGKRMLFRFVSIYVVLYFFPIPEDFLPGSQWLIAAWAKLFLRPTPWLCKTVLGVPCEAPTGVYANGDTAADHAALLLVAVTTVV